MKQKHIVTKQLSFLIAMILVCLQLLPIGAFAVGQTQPQEEMMQAQAASTKKYRSPFIAKGYTSGAYYKQPGSSWSAGYHTGQDYNCSNDTLVAPASGTIQRSRWDNSYGNYIVIATNDGWVILMAHMASTPLVKEGQKVTAGQRVGTMGSTGNVTGKHLHLEIESSSTWAYNKNLQDPRQYIDLDNYGGSSTGGSDIYQNGSTKEYVYSTWSSCNAQGSDYIGYIDPYETANVYGSYNGLYIVVYNAGSTKKAGFVKYSGGNTNPYWNPKTYSNGSTSEPVYRSLADAKNKTNAIGSLDPWETCTCVKVVEGKPVVLYTAGSTKKVGFVNYMGGVS